MSEDSSKCGCGSRARVEWGKTQMCQECAARHIKTALRLVAEERVPLAYLAGYGSVPDFVRDHLLPAMAPFFVDSDSFGRNRCMAITGEGRFCYEVSRDSIRVSQQQTEGWGPEYVADLYLCKHHKWGWEDRIVEFKSAADEATAVELSRGIVGEWRQSLSDWDRECAAASASGQPLPPNPLPKLTKHDLDRVWPYVGSVLRLQLLDEEDDSSERRFIRRVLRDMETNVDRAGNLIVTIGPNDWADSVKRAARLVAAALEQIRGHSIAIKYDRADIRASRAASRVEEHREFIVYRCFNGSGDLLYVGQTTEGVKRLRQHEKDKSWWPEVETVRQQKCASREEMNEVELRAIREENPRYNVAGRPRKAVAV